jgi:hypothetical protein
MGAGKVAAWALLAFGAVGYVWALKTRFDSAGRAAAEERRAGREWTELAASRLGTAVGGWWAVVGAFMLMMALAVHDFSDDDSALDEAATREGLVVLGLVLVAGGLASLWVARRAHDGIPGARQHLTWTFVAWCALTLALTLANPAVLPAASVHFGVCLAGALATGRPASSPKPHPGTGTGPHAGSDP